MSIDFLPAVYTRATATTVVVPVSDVADLTDPSSGRIVIPSRVEIILTLFEGTERGDRIHVYVAVVGPRRLKSGAAGQSITAFGWQSVRNEGRHSFTVRPSWLTQMLTAHLPMGWDPALLDLAVTS